jgi:hypothetical protein
MLPEKVSNSNAFNGSFSTIKKYVNVLSIIFIDNLDKLPIAGIRNK